MNQRQTRHPIEFLDLEKKENRWECGECSEWWVVGVVSVVQWRRNHRGFGDWCPHKNYREQHIPRVVIFTQTSIALSCSARTDVLNCSAGTDGTETDRFFCQKPFSVRGAFSWFEAGVLLKTPMFLNDCYPFLFIQNHSAITQLFYVTSSSLKPIVHDLLCSEMLRERNSSPSWKVSQKNFHASCGDPTSPSSVPPYLPTSSYATVVSGGCSECSECSDWWV